MLWFSLHWQSFGDDYRCLALNRWVPQKVYIKKKIIWRKYRF